jgi:hypothetical protein
MAAASNADVTFRQKIVLDIDKNVMHLDTHLYLIWVRFCGQWQRDEIRMPSWITSSHENLAMDPR